MTDTKKLKLVEEFVQQCWTYYDPTKPSIIYKDIWRYVCWVFEPDNFQEHDLSESISIPEFRGWYNTNILKSK